MSKLYNRLLDNCPGAQLGAIDQIEKASAGTSDLEIWSLVQDSRIASFRQDGIEGRVSIRVFGRRELGDLEIEHHEVDLSIGMAEPVIEQVLAVELYQGMENDKPFPGSLRVNCRYAVTTIDPEASTRWT